jgi:hypothetical protein
MPVENWDFLCDDRNELVIGGLSAGDLVRKYSRLAQTSFNVSLWSKV